MNNISNSFVSKGDQFSCKNGLYAAVEPVYGTRALTELVGSTFDSLQDPYQLDLDDLHLTLMYSKQTPDAQRVKALISNPVHSVIGIPLRFRYWDGHDKKGYIVLEMESPDLAARHEQYKEAGCEHSFDDYTPHVTIRNNLSADLGNKFCAIANSRLHRLPNIVFGGEQISDLRD